MSILSLSANQKYVGITYSSYFYVTQHNKDRMFGAQSTAWLFSLSAICLNARVVSSLGKFIKFDHHDTNWSNSSPSIYSKDSFDYLLMYLFIFPLQQRRINVKNVNKNLGHAIDAPKQTVVYYPFSVRF